MSNGVEYLCCVKLCGRPGRRNEIDGRVFCDKHYVPSRLAIPPTPPIREAILNDAIAATRDRQDSHGKPEDSFGAIARLWEGYLSPLTGGAEITPHDVALMMVLFKVARSIGNPDHRDNYVDMAGYGALAGEVAGVGGEA